MGNYKEPIIVGIIIVIAFIGGYKQNALLQYWKNGLTIDSTATTIEDKKQLPKHTVTVQKPKIETKGQKPLLKRQTSPYTRMLRNSIPKAPPKGPHLVPPPNPYRETFKSTMESIRPGVIGKKQHQKRNLYFDRLREQLHEIQGQSPSNNNGKNLLNSEEAKKDAREKEMQDQQQRSFNNAAAESPSNLMDNYDIDSEQLDELENDPDITEEELENAIEEILVQESIQ